MPLRSGHLSPREERGYIATGDIYIHKEGRLSSHISNIFLASGAYTAITIVVPKRIAVLLSSNFHDLLIVQNCFATNNVAKPELLP